MSVADAAHSQFEQAYQLVRNMVGKLAAVMHTNKRVHYYVIGHHNNI